MVRSYYERKRKIFETSDQNAFVCYDETRTYAEMYTLMRRANTFLSRFTNRRIVIYAGKTFANYGCLHAILLSGNTWVPLNPDHPPQRVLEMMRIADPGMILTDRDLPDVLAAHAAEAGIEVHQLDTVTASETETDFDLDRIEPDNEAMVYFTSGSTGVPKGVPLTHANYTNTVENLLKILPLRKGEIFCDYHDLGFVISVPILFPCVMSESTIAPARDKLDIMMPINHLQKHGVTVFITVPSTYARLRQLQPDGVPGLDLNVMVSCGEPLYPDVLDYCLNKMGASEVNNFYGSTEVSCWTFRQVCGPVELDKYRDMGVLPIGNTLPGTEMKVGDADELMVEGVQITPGYLGGVNPDAFVDEEGKHWYRTGDKVVRDDDVWVCKGRLDSQVKIQGNRVDLLDVEAQVRKYDGVRGAVCFVDDTGPNKYIVSILHSRENFDKDGVRPFLGGHLPDYMIPRKVYALEKMPLNKSGKIDRAGVKKAYFDGELD